MRWLLDLSLLATVGFRQLREEPALLLVQATRRLPAGLRRRVEPALGEFARRAPLPTVPRAWLAHVAGQPGLARTLLAGHEDRAGLLASQLGLDPGPGDRTNAARVALARGELTRAVELGRGTPVAQRAASELRLLEPGSRLAAPSRPAPAPAPATDGTRVAFLLTNSLPHTQSGYAQRTQSLLTALRATGVEAEAWTRLGWPATVGKVGTADVDVVEGVRYHRLRAASLPHALDERWKRQVDVFARALGGFRPHVLHTTTEYPNGLVAQAVARSLGIPWVYEMRGQVELSWVASRPEAWRDDAAASERVALWRAKETELALDADAVVVLSQVQADELASRGVEPARIHVVPNATDPALLSRDSRPADARRRVGLPTQGCWVGTVSSLVGYEGLDTLLRAVAAARAGGTDVRCAIVGDGVAEPELRRLGAELGLGEALVMPGRKPRGEALDWYEALGVFVVPRRDTPVCRVVTPMKPLEAMALGRPVVASDLPALAEVVGDGGVLVGAEDVDALASALVALAGDEARRIELGRLAREAASARTWPSDAGIFGRMYADLLGRPAPELD